MAERCVFCGGTPTTAEHIFSWKWIQSIMPKSSSFTTSLSHVEHDVPKLDETWTTPVTKKSQAGSITVSCVCAPCNNGWMQDLDNSLREALTGLAGAAEPGRLSVEGCRLLARWASKIAMLVDELWNPGVMDPAMKLAFRTSNGPVDGWYFWIGLMDVSREETHLRAMTLHPSPGSPDVEAVAVTFRVLHMFVQVVAPLKPGIVVWRTAQASPYVWQFWPSVLPLYWPPPRRLRITPDAIEQLEQSFRAKPK